MVLHLPLVLHTHVVLPAPAHGAAPAHAAAHAIRAAPASATGPPLWLSPCNGAHADDDVSVPCLAARAATAAVLC